MRALLYAHGLEEILDMPYAPNPMNPKAVKAWNRKQQFTHTMLTEGVLVHTSRPIVQWYDETLDGCLTLMDLTVKAQRSTKAVLAGCCTREKIAQTQYDSQTGSALSFITKFEELMETYNLQQCNPSMVLTDPMRKSYLQTAVAGVMMLWAVSNWENDCTVKGGPAYSYDEYLEAIKNAATIYDEHSSRRRTVHTIQASEDYNMVDEITDYVINMTKKQAPGPSMNKDTWQTISEDGKAIWDKLSNRKKQ